MKAQANIAIAPFGRWQILAEIETGIFQFSAAEEDIRQNIEDHLGQIIAPEVAGRLHTARSRNDEVATDFRLWVRDAIDRLDREIIALQAALLYRAAEHTATIMH